MINLCGLWKNTTKDGREYFSGNLGDAKVLIFTNDKKGNDKAPDFRLCLAEKTKKSTTENTSNTTENNFTDESIPF
jgi:uncharacterized protein (DUF736 family)